MKHYALLVVVLALGGCDPVRKLPEWKQQLDRIAAAAKKYAAQHGNTFPLGNGAPTPAHTCCVPPNNKCAVEPALWQTAPWSELGFAMTVPHYFQYSYASDGKTFTATAISDLDCDTNTATWTVRGTIGPDGPTTTMIELPPKGSY